MEVTVVYSDGTKKDVHVRYPQLVPNVGEEVYIDNSPFVVTYRSFDLIGGGILHNGIVLTEK